MNEKPKEQAKLIYRFNQLVDDYVAEFCKQMDLCVDPKTIYWVGDEKGGITEICDLFLSYDNIRYCVDNNIAYDELSEWYDYTVMIHSVTENAKTPSLDAWHRGCPRMSQKQIRDLINTKDKIEQLKKELGDMIEQYRKNPEC